MGKTTEQAIRELPETGFSFRLATDDIRILAVTHLAVREVGVFGEGVRFEIRVPDGYWRRKG